MKNLTRSLAPALLSLGLLTTAARADVPPAETPATEPSVNPLKRQGDEAMDNLRFVEAIALYKQAYEATSDPAILYNLGRAHEAVGDNPAALDALLAFEAKAPPELRQRVPGLAQRIAALRARIVTLDVRVNVPGARVLIQRVEIGRSPLQPVRTNAGRLTVRVEQEEHRPYQTELETVGGRDYVVEANLAPRSTTGVLVVRSPQLGAQVEVDGRAVGQAPLETITSVGEHQVVLKKVGYQPRATSVVVNRDTPKEIDVVLEPTSSIASRWWFWAGIGLVVAGGIVTTVALTSEREPGTGSIAPGRVSGPLVIGF